LQVAEPNTDTTTTIEDTAPDAAGITIQPDGTESVREITFENEEATGSVRIREYTNTDSLPQSLRDEIADSTTAAGATPTNTADIVSVSDITPDTEAAEDSAARVTFSVPAEEVDNPDQLAVVKQSFDFAQQADTWRQMDTSVEQATSDEIIVTTEVDRFSVFILTEEPAPTTDTGDGETNNTTTTDDTETGDGAPGFGVIPAIVALIAAALVVHKNRTS
jgi:PGF-CTERM protein